jgi:hypothetical protein
MEDMKDIFKLLAALGLGSIMNTFITFITEHQFISNNAELASLAENIEKSMADLYLKIGAQKEFWDDEKV